MPKLCFVSMKEKNLNQELFDESYRFDFFQAVRLLERMYPERKAVGRSVTPQEEIVRFRTKVSLKFPPSEIHEISESYDEFSDRQELEMFIN